MYLYLFEILNISAIELELIFILFLIQLSYNN